MLQIIGPVLDIQFRGKETARNEFPLPGLYEILMGNQVTCEVQQILGEGIIRTVAMSSTDGLRRGDEAYAMGSLLKVPVGRGTLGRIFNVLGVTVDR